MRLPRDLGGDDLIKKLRAVGYEPTRQTGSHVRLTRETAEGSQHLTVPRHKALRVGTLSRIVGRLSEHLRISKAEVIRLIS